MRGSDLYFAVQGFVHRATVGNLQHSLPLRIRKVSIERKLTMKLVDLSVSLFAINAILGMDPTVTYVDRCRAQVDFLVIRIHA
jgi:hypothetical protein